MASQQAVDEITSAAENALDKIEKRPFIQQVTIGAASGLVTGYALAKIGKSAAFLLGVTAIGLQFVLSRKESAINWKKIEDEAREAFERASQQKQRSTLPPKLVTAFKQNQAFFGSFGGGFLIGISFS
uniref:FUN14 domain-containing protein 1 n=1 Tax=Mesocestoides corti TaxID=53468 RepID=A0A5K3F2A7_MESCO